jgi:hypothetical protein
LAPQRSFWKSALPGNITGGLEAHSEARNA